MKIAALLPFSMIDYPDELSAVIFTQGCPLRCHYCHNKKFQNINDPSSIDFSSIINFLQNRIGLLSAVVFSGGEPLLQQDLYESMQKIKDLGFLIGLHTSGAIYKNFLNVLPIVNWVGFDIKTNLNNYYSITKVNNYDIEKSIKTLFQYNVPYEIRTTVDSRFIKQFNLIEIAKFLNKNGVKEWVLQECILREENNIHLPLPSDLDISELSQYIKIKVRRA